MADITPEKKMEYSQRQSIKNKENRRQRQNERKNGLTDTRRLAFIDNIVKAYGYTQVTLAKLLDCTPQNIYWIFSVRDDCAVSKAQEILGAMKLALRIELKRKEPAINKAEKLNTATFQSNAVVNKIKGEIPFINGTSTSQVPDYVRDCPKDSRIRFLADFLIENNYSINYLEQIVGIAHGNIMNYFIRQDMPISKVYDIARVTESEIIWNINPLKG